jgi:7-keto-8-aminopelargonate synthetase-like enzyme
MADLELRLEGSGQRAVPADRDRRVFSMDGTIADLSGICDLSGIDTTRW